MHFALVGLAFCAAASASPFAVVADPAGVVSTIDVAKSAVVSRDEAAVSNANGGGLLGLGGLLNSVLGVVGNLVHPVVGIVSNLDHELGLTLSHLLRSVHGIVDDITEELNGASDLDVLDGLVNELESTIDSVDGLLNGILGELSPSLARTVKKLLKKLNVLLSSVEKEVSSISIKRDTQGGGLLGVVGDLVGTIDSLTDQIDSLLIRVLKSISPSLGKELKKLLWSVDSLVRKVEQIVEGVLDDVDLSSVLDELDRTVDDLTALVNKILKSVDPSLARTVKQLLKSVTKLVDNLENQVGGLL